MANALYSPAAGADPYALDVSQFAHALQGTLDPGAVTFAGPSASPVAPSVALQSGSLSGAYQWVAWWITGVPVGGSATPNVNGTTAAGTATTTQALSSQEAVLTVPASPPSTAVGCGFGRTLAGGSVFYEIPGATVYKTAAGAWPQYTDNTADSSLVTAVPAANTTGTPLTLGAGATVASGQTLALSGVTVSGGPTFSGEPVFQGAINMESAFYFGSALSAIPSFIGFGFTDGTTPTGYSSMFFNLNTSPLAVNGPIYANASPISTTRAVSIGDATGTSYIDGSGYAVLAGGLSTSSGYGFTGVSGSAMLYNPTSSQLLWLIGTGGAYWANAANTAILLSLDTSGDLSAAGYVQGTQLRSTVATGTAPFTVASTTQVANLNVSGLGGTLEVEVATFIAQEGGALGSTDINSDQVEIGTVSPNATYYFEAAVAGGNGATVTITLYDATTATAVTSVTTASATDTTAHRSGAITLTAGHQFYVQLTSVNDIYSGGIARIVAKI